MAIVHGQGNVAPSSEQAISESYRKKIFDAEFAPTVITDDKGIPLGQLLDNDVVIFFNFNSTLLRPLASLLLDNVNPVQESAYISVTDYDIPRIKSLTEFSFQQNSLGEVISKAGYRQLRLADSEGYVPITVFLNGGYDKNFTGEDRELIPLSLSNEYIKMYDTSNQKVAKRAVRVIEDNKYDFIAINFSALDRISHIGNLKSAIAIVKSIDNALHKIINSVLQAHGVAVIVGSHGLAETIDFLNEDKISSHTKNPVPVILVGEQFAGYSLGLPEAIGGDLSVLKSAGSLIDVAPTILSLMKLSVPSEMTGQSFIDELTIL
jgi:2,3-bisphosphoglycerate-independent phosphoglycerate mutase